MQKVYISNGARERIITIFDREIALADKHEQVLVRAVLARLKSEVLAC